MSLTYGGSTLTETVPTGSAPVAASAPGGGAPGATNAARPRRRVFGPRPGAVPPQPYNAAPAAGASAGPNPMAMNSTGLAAQGATADSVMYTGGPLTETVPAGGSMVARGYVAPTNTTPWRAPPGVYDVNDHHWAMRHEQIRQNEAIRNRYLPFATEGMTRLNGQLGNFQPGTMRAFTGVGAPTDEDMGGVEGLAAGAVGNVGALNDGLMMTPDVARGALAQGDTLAARLGTGAVTAETGGDLVDAGVRSEQQTGKLGGLSDANYRAAMSLDQLPDRGALATDYAGRLNAQDDIGFKRDLDAIRELNAADGRNGLAADNKINDLLAQRGASRDARNSGLALDAAAGSVADRTSRLGALSGVYGQEQGVQSGLRGEGRTDRNYRTGVATGNADRALGAKTSAYGLGGNTAAASAQNQLGRLGAANQTAESLAGLGAARRGEARTERGQALTYDQQNIANQLGLNAHQFSQMMELLGYSDPNKLTQAYSGLTGTEAGVATSIINNS